MKLTICFFLGNVTVNNAQIIETEVFVYNLGTMFYIDELLYSDILANFVRKTSTSTSTSTTSILTSTKPSIYAYSTMGDVELVPSEITESSDGEDGQDVLFQQDNKEYDDEIITPRALPLLYVDSPK